MTRTIFCIKLNRQAEGLDFVPYPGELGTRIYENISKEAWQEWLAKQIMLINEYRLNLSEPSARSFLSKEMEQHFFGDGGQIPAGYVPKEKA